ncbi:MAG: type II secretion system protein M [Desulfobacterales bacterium]|nr:type II secretion system protein M [Desulfobacterales bacterium]
MIRFSKREQRMVYTAAGLIVVFLVCWLMVIPVIDKKERLQRALAVGSRDLAEIQVVIAEYNRLQQESSATRKQMTARKTGFTLFSFLEKMAGATRLKDRIAYMKPSDSAPKNSPFKISTVEMKLQAITLEQLVNYLYKIETADSAVQVKRISIVKTERARGLISATMEIESFRI